MHGRVLATGGLCLGTEADGLTDELRRRARVADQMLSAHAVLRDRYLWHAKLLDLVSFGLATLLCALTFSDPTRLLPIGLPAMTWAVVLGMASLGLFLLSVVDLLVDWKGQAGRHGQACEALARVKSEASELIALNPAPVEQVVVFLRAAALTAGSQVPIPERQFAALKAYHKHKVEVSRCLELHPSAPAWLVGLALRCRSSWAVLKGGGGENGG